MAIKFSQFSDGNQLKVGDTVVGLRDDTNTKFEFPSDGFKDSNGHYLLGYDSLSDTASCYLLVQNNESGAPVTLTAYSASDSDVDMLLTNLGNGDIDLTTDGTGAINLEAFGGQVLANGSHFVKTASSVNYLQFYTAITGSAPLISVEGADSVIDLNFSTKGGINRFYGVPSDVMEWRNTDVRTNWIAHNISGITTGRTITWPDASGTVALTSGTVASITGTANRITISGTSTNPIIDIASTYVGQASITTLGTIATGVWNSTAIGVTKGGTGLTSTTANQLLYSSSNNVIAGLATANNGVLVTSGAGVPSISSTLPSALTLPSPRVTTAIYDANSNIILELSPIASAANYINIANSVSGAPSFSVLGASADINFNISTKGLGYLAVIGPSSNALRLYNTLDNSQFLNFDISALTAGRSFAWPDVAGTVALTTSTVSTATNLAGGSANQIPYQTGSGATSFISAAANGVLVTSSGSVPSISTTLPSSLTLPSPKITTAIYDTNSNIIMSMAPQASSVNYLVLYNAATGNSPKFVTEGSDTNINLALATKGTGYIKLAGGNNSGSPIVAFVAGGTAAGFLFHSFTSSGVDRTATWPDASGTVAYTSSNVTSATNLAGGSANQIPYQTGAGATSFITAGASGVLVTNGSNVPSISSTLPANLTITTPIITSLKDSSGNLSFSFAAASVSDVNYPKTIASATGANVLYTVDGSDADIGITIFPKGAKTTGIYSQQSGGNYYIDLLRGVDAARARLILNSIPAATVNSYTFPAASGTFVVSSTAGVGLVSSPANSSTVTAAFGASLTAGTAVQNTTSYNIQLNICVNVTSSTTATIVLGVGTTNTPTTNTVIPSFTVAATTFFTFTAIVPNNYYVLVNTTGTIVVSSITCQACGV